MSENKVIERQSCIDCLGLEKEPYLTRGELDGDFCEVLNINISLKALTISNRCKDFSRDENK